MFIQTKLGQMLAHCDLYRYKKPRCVLYVTCLRCLVSCHWVNRAQCYSTAAGNGDEFLNRSSSSSRIRPQQGCCLHGYRQQNTHIRMYIHKNNKIKVKFALYTLESIMGVEV